MTHDHDAHCDGDSYVRLSTQLLTFQQQRDPAPAPDVLAAAEAVDLLIETYANPFTKAATATMTRALASDPGMAGLVIGTLVEIVRVADRKLDEGHRLFHAQDAQVQATIRATEQATSRVRADD